MKETIQQKMAHKKMCENLSQENKAKKVVANSMRKEAEKELAKLNKKNKQHFCAGEIHEKRWKRQ